MNKGFSLLEVAIVLFIMALLLGTVLGPISVQREVQNIRETKKTLEEVKNALLGYALVKGHLPCPEIPIVNVPLTGIAAATCNEKEGYLPYASLGGIGEKDSWGNRFRYRVDTRYSLPLDDINTIYTTSNLSVYTLDDREFTGSVQNEAVNPKTTHSTAVAIMFSCGKNGIPDEKNAHSGGTECSNSTDPPNSTYTQDVVMPNYDDILTWISKYQVINALNNAGKWK